MNHKKKLALLFGGKSTEHEISILSARNIYNAISKEKFEVICIYIEPTGRFFLISEFSEFPGNSKEIFRLSKKPIYFQSDSKAPFVYWENGNMQLVFVDVFFPITHGTMGEDGSLQGLLKLSSIPFVGCDVLSSALCMDKEAMKRVLIANEIPVTPYFSFSFQEKETIPFRTIIKQFHLPVFIKPARQGSSVGVYKANTEEELKYFVHQAFQYDTKILIEKAITGKEIECSVLGNFDPRATSPGEICSNHEFYSYEAKYLDPDGAALYIPATDLTKQEMENIKQMALQTYRALYCEGFARVDMFYSNGDIFINEVNTLPGFTDISMYPKLWEYEGIKQSRLIERLIELAEERASLMGKLQLKHPD